MNHHGTNLIFFIFQAQVHEFKVAMTCESCSGAVERVLNKHKGEYLFCLNNTNAVQ